MMNESKKQQSGFTLVEIMMVVLVFSMIIYGLTELISGIIIDSDKQSMLLSDSDQARKVAFNLTNELRNASTGADGGYVLNQAGNQQLIFYSNIDSALDVEKVRYFIAAGKLYKGVTKPFGTVYNMNDDEEVTLIQNHVANNTTPLFYYYDGAYNGTVDNFLPQPVSIAGVRLIKINLMITNVGGRANTNSYTVTASGTIRNIKSNLGS